MIKLSNLMKKVSLMMQAFYEGIITKFQEKVKLRPDLKAAYVIGSQGRVARRADEWSDLDILLYTDQPDDYLTSTAFAESLGMVWNSIVVKNPCGDDERQTIYEGGFKLDLVLKDFADYEKHLENETVPGYLQRGAQLIVENDERANKLLPEEIAPPSKEPITQEGLDQLNQKFWFVTMAISKQLLRKENWAAKAYDGEYHQLLLQVVEWFEMALRGEDYDTWHDGRYLEEWVEPAIYDELIGTFVGFDTDSNWDALQNSMNLFTRLARSIATKKGLDLDESLRENVVKWIATKRIGELFGRD